MSALYIKEIILALLQIYGLYQASLRNTKRNGKALLAGSLKNELYFCGFPKFIGNNLWLRLETRLEITKDRACT